MCFKADGSKRERVVLNIHSVLYIMMSLYKIM